MIKLICLIIAMVSQILVVTSSNVQLLDVRNSTYGEISPKQIELLSIKALISKGSFEDALFEIMELDDDFHGSPWVDYYRASAYLGLARLEDGSKALRDCLKHRQIVVEREDQRVVGLCLKRKGWVQRVLKDYTPAFLSHHERLQIVLEMGSPFEIHDS